MSPLYVVGAGGTGKTTLINEYCATARTPKPRLIREVARTFMKHERISQADLENPVVFWKLQADVICAQINQEGSQHGHHYISDRSCLDALVYASICVPRRFPLLETETTIHTDPTETEVEALFAPLLGADSREMIVDIVDRYRTSLFVLVHPFSDTVEDDGVRKAFEPNELNRFTTMYQKILCLLRIPFLDLRERELAVRVRLLKQALMQHKIPSPLSDLAHFQNISNKKKVDKDAVSRHYRDINLPFYLPRPGKMTVPCLTLSTSEVSLSFSSDQPGKVSRFLRRYGGEYLFLLEFTTDIPATGVYEILNAGVMIQGAVYSYLGCSSSGLKSRKCFLWRGSAADAEGIREANGNFSQITSVAKRTARFSLLLTNVVPTDIRPLDVIKEPDVVLGDGKNFTDGCGCINPDYARSLFNQTGKALSRKSDSVHVLPSVFQVRFQGFKGILVRNSSLRSGAIVVRPSMEKFSTDTFPTIDVCDHSRPFSFGHLNRQFIVLLSGLGVPDQVFLELQQQHFDRLSKMLDDRDSALMLIEWHNRAEELLQMTRDEVSFTDRWVARRDTADSTASYEYLRRLQRRLIVHESPRLRILIPESRNLFGVAEPPRYARNSRLRGILKYGECLVRLTMRGEGPFSLHNQQVVVSKNPCYLLGDVRVLRAVSSLERPELRALERDLIDCIVFPIEGPQPHSEQIAGSDLDGDQYFVCWDERLIPPTTRPAYSYPAYRDRSPRPRGGSCASAEMIRYFSIQNEVSSRTGQVDALFRAWADRHGADCNECTRLGQLFSRVVDSAKSGEKIQIPQALRIPKAERLQPSANSQFVWQRMEYIAKSFAEEYQTQEAMSGTLLSSQNDQYPSSAVNTFLLNFVSRNHLAMSEFTKFRFVMEHLKYDIEEFLHSPFLDHVNFALFNPAERGYAVERYGFPREVMGNALRCYSHILAPRLEFLQKFGFDENLPFQFYWRGRDLDEKSDFHSVLKYALRLHTDVLVALEVPGSVFFVLRFAREVMGRNKADRLFEPPKDDHELRIKGFMKIQSYFISDHFGYLMKYSLENPEYLIDLISDGSERKGQSLQIYRGEINQTFLSLKEGTSVVSGGRKARTEDDGVKVLEVSVDLTRFNSRILTNSRRHSLVRKAPVQLIEMFVYNRQFSFLEQSDNSTYYMDVLFNNQKKSLEMEERCFEGLIPDVDSIDDLMPCLESMRSDLRQLDRIDFSSDDPARQLAEVAQSIKRLCQRYALLCSMPRGVEESIISKCAEIANSLTSFKGVLPGIVSAAVETAGILSVLGVEVSQCLTSLDVRRDPTFEVVDFASLARRWDFWLALPNSIARQHFLEWLESGIDEENLSSRNQFVYRNALEQVRILVHELNEDTSAFVLENLRLETLRPGWIDGDNESLDTNLADNLPLVTLFRVQAAPCSLELSVGEYICLRKQWVPLQDQDVQSFRSDTTALRTHSGEWSSQEYDDDFPPLTAINPGSRKSGDSETTPADNVSKSAGFCLGQIMYLCEAPFSMTVKMIPWSFGEDRAPELVLRCLESRKLVYWQIRKVPANIITHTRNIDAIISFLDPDLSHGQTVGSELLPFFYGTDIGGGRNESPFGVPDLSSVCLQALNAGQNEAMRACFLQRVSLVHGPPGTGNCS